MKKYILLILCTIFLCSCAENDNAEMTTAPSVTSAQTTTSAEITSTTAKVPEPVPVTEVEADMDCDGVNERLVLHPDAANENSVIYCYAADGTLLGKLGSRDYFEQLTELELKWYDDGQAVYPALMSKCENDFFYAEYAVKLYLDEGKPRALRIWQKDGLRENYGPIADMEYYSDISGEWISEKKYNEYCADIYDNIADAPSYQNGILLTKALKALAAEGIPAERSCADIVDIDGDGTDEVTAYSDGKIYCISGDTMGVIGSAEFRHDGYTLEWYNDRETVFPVARAKSDTSDCLYKLAINGGEFECTLLAGRDGEKYTGENGAPITEKEYLTACYYTWENKQNRIEYAVSAAADSLGAGILSDADGDGIPELLTGYKNYTYLDSEISISRLDTPTVTYLGGMCSDDGGYIRQYYDKAADEYFYITEYNGYGMTCREEYYAEKTTAYKTGCYTENIASEEYYFDSYSKENSGALMLANSDFMGEKLDEYRYTDKAEKLYTDRLENYLDGFDFVDSINVDSLFGIEYGSYDERYEQYMAQALEIERRYLASPTAEPPQKTICFNGEDIYINAAHIDIDPYEIPESEWEKLSEFTNLHSLYFYNFDIEEQAEFDLGLLNGVSDRITDISFYNISADYTKLQDFPKLRSLCLNDCGTQALTAASKLTNLTSLMFYAPNDEAVDLSPLSSLVNLEFFGVSGKINNLDFTRNTKKLKEIYYAAYSDEDGCFAALSELPELKALSMSGMLYPIPTEEQQKDIGALDDDIITPQFK